MRYVFLALFAAVSLVHLYHSWLDVTKKRRMTKWALLLLLLGYYLTSTSTFSPLLIAALLCSWLGDVLLMPSGNGWFVSGGISFLAAHVLFVLLYLGQVDFAAVNWLIAVPVALVYIAAVTVILALLKKETPKPMFVPMFLYLLMNGAMNVFALMQLLTNPCAGAAVAYLGAILFFVSDSTLYLNKYYKKKQIVPKKHFTIMLTYLLGEFLIVQGMLMLGL
ncbi:MAG: lysoplasmalogenase [Clostridia bacterium]|nr:lysoplasmalogenase [Clostridia bacterium]